MSTCNTRRSRILLRVVLATCLLFSTGCVYWRLNKFRKQLSRFPEYGYVEQQAGPTVVFQKPVLKPDDLEWLVGLQPSQRIEDGETVRETYNFRKLYPEDAVDEEGGSFDLPLETTYVKGELQQIMFPRRLDQLISNKQIEELFEEISRAKIKADSSTTSWKIGDSLAIPRFNNLMGFAGRPYRLESIGGEWLAHYRYQVADVVDPAGPVDASASLAFRKHDGKLTQGQIRIGYLQIHLRFGGGEQDDVTLKRVP